MVGRGHLEGVGSIEGAAKAKSEIYEFAPAKAVQIFNLDNEHTRKMYEAFGKSAPADRVMTFATFGASTPTGFPTPNVALEVVSATPIALRVRGVIAGVEGETEVPVFGRHNVTNLMVAASFALASGMTGQEIWSALPECRTAWGRNQWVDLECGAKVLFDAYNANPESMRAAIENFATIQPPPGGRKIAVLGEMRELGSHAPELHKEIGVAAGRAGFDHVCFVGPTGSSFEVGIKSSGFSKTLFVTSTYEIKLASTMLPVLDRNDIVLIKGSRGMQLEKVLADLKPIGFETKK
jgi:UDP-N-acetylmuramoyl-tripeptide--D-alanyl-D-alanine ligase